MTDKTDLAAWVAKCEACGTVYPLPRFPIGSYVAGQAIIRPDDFGSANIPCFCGRTIKTDRNGLVFVRIAGLSIRRTSSGDFQVKQRFGGATTDLGPMSETQLRAYLGNRSLVGLLPEQVLERLAGTGDLAVQMVVSIVRPAVAPASAQA